MFDRIGVKRSGHAHDQRIPTRLKGLGRVVVPAAICLAVVTGLASGGAGAALKAKSKAGTATPIKHVVVIFDENVSFDHYFASYPSAVNEGGSTFYAAPGTPSVNGLSGSLLTANPNGTNPTRLDPTNVNDVLTCSQNHSYTPEQNAEDGGAMDHFTATNGTATTSGKDPEGIACNTAPESGIVMDYYDGNTVTGIWNYAQHYAMSDNNFETSFGPSSPGAVNLVSGDTGGVDTSHEIGSFASDVTSDGNGGQSLIGDANPYWDDCSPSGAVLALKGENVGNLLNAAGLSWGWFQGGFTPNTPYTGTVDTPLTYAPPASTSPAPDNTPVACSSTHDVGAAVGGNGTNYGTNADYVEHWEPFQFYASTANPHHLAPTSLSVVGTDTAAPGEFDTANHQYDVSTFNSLVAAIDNGSIPADNLPAVSYLKAPQYESGHPSSSDPVDEQVWLTDEINQIESLPTWSSTAIFVTYDDSDGDYDHVFSGIVNPSQGTADTLSSAGKCGAEPPSPLGNEQGRCGFATRLPLMLVSPCAKQNYVSRDESDQASILNFIEYNWSLPSIPGSFDQALAQTDRKEGIPYDLAGLFDFKKCDAPSFQVDPATGEMNLQNAADAGQNLKGVNDSSAEAMNGNFAGVNFLGAFLEGTNFTGANLSGANFNKADLANANFTGADLRGANLHNSTLTGATWSNTTCPDRTNSNNDGGSCSSHL